VHDVVFRVRFGGYDEWQVDLHLDRVERQLAELEERGGYGGRGAPERMGPPDRLGPPDRMGASTGMGSGMTERIAPVRDDRMPPPSSMPPRPMPVQGASPRDPYGQYGDEQTGGFDRGGFDRGPRGGGFDRGFDGPSREFDGPPSREFDGPPARGMEGPPSRAGFDGPSGGFAAGAPGPGYGADRFGGPEERFDGFAAGRHGKADMTAEIRMPDRGLDGPMGGPPMGGPPPVGGLPPELQRIDHLRRTFQVRRFGSGYDPVQVDRLFEGILAAVTGRGPMPMNPAELDRAQFGLVPGGYFEAEVDAALKEVQDLLRRQ
jgi:DivIVA domain-containing protein